MGKWSRRVQALGHSALEVVQAEVHSLLEDFQSTGRGVLKALVVFLAAGAFVFWGVGVLTAAAVAVLALWLALWQATLVVFLAMILTAAGLGWWGWRVIQRLEGPTTTVRRHVDDHIGWWRGHLADDRGRLGRGASPRPSVAEVMEDEEWQE
ncbi:MAG: phage holin family protein [Acidobacteria bacterium]|nr:phage holin family protein [Acidobacteriota bacterium]